MSRIPGGIYPVMITPFTADNKIDWEAVDRIVEFYIEKGCQGVFAACQSSEIFWLNEEERVELTARVVKAAKGRLAVVASGHTSDAIEDQIRELKRISATGVDAAVMISNRLAKQDEDDDVFIANLEKILAAIPNVTFGMYECPYPYKRLLSGKVLKYMAESGRFSFIKDTCCDAELIYHRLDVLKGSTVQLFNANAATALDTIEHGCDGFSGVMANFHPELWTWLYANYKTQPEKAHKLNAFLSFFSGAERCCYPVSAKYHMNLIGIPMTLVTRTRDWKEFNKLNELEVQDLLSCEQQLKAEYGIK